MRIKLFQVDAFADELFGGNPAAVCPLDDWLDDDVMQSIAAENNLSETAFFSLREHPFNIRWFTPTIEVELCGHATLASAHVLYHHLEYKQNPIHFNSVSGPLNVIAEGDGVYTLDFPVDELTEIDLPTDIASCFNHPFEDAQRGFTDFLLRVKNEQSVLDMDVDFKRLANAEGRGFIVTAPGSDCDYVARCFYPQTGVNEDPATGSSQTSLVRYWSEILGKNQFKARQLSERGAYFETELSEDRVLITGKAISYLEGHIEV